MHHNSAKQSCDRMSSVCDVGGSGSHGLTLEILETNCTDN